MMVGVVEVVVFEIYVENVGGMGMGLVVFVDGCCGGWWFFSGWCVGG